MLLFPGFQLLDLAGPTDAFGEVKVISKGEYSYEVLTVGTTRGTIKSSSGITVQPDRTIFDACPEFDTLLVPGGIGVFDILEDSTIKHWLNVQCKGNRRIAAICNGGFVLGAAGLLQGRTVSTHWMDATRMAEMFPRTKVEADSIYIKDGQYYTTAGVTAGIDLSLALIEEDVGKAIAVGVARYLVVHLRRTGGQSQFSPLLNMQAQSNSVVGSIQEYVLANLEMQHSVATIAANFHMSSRNLARVFDKAIGVSPMAFVNDARVDAVRRYLETSNLPIKAVAAKCGFPTAESLRRLFSQKMGVGPNEYRKRFQ